MNFSLQSLIGYFFLIVNWIFFPIFKFQPSIEFSFQNLNGFSVQFLYGLLYFLFYSFINKYRRHGKRLKGIDNKNDQKGAIQRSSQSQSGTYYIT